MNTVSQVRLKNWQKSYNLIGFFLESISNVIKKILTRCKNKWVNIYKYIFQVLISKKKDIYKVNKRVLMEILESRKRNFYLLQLSHSIVDGF